MTTSDICSATRRGSAASDRTAVRDSRVPGPAAQPGGAGTAGALEDQPGPDRSARACLILDAQAERVTLAREFIGEVLGRGHPCAETAVLLASQLVTNSVRHSGCRQQGQTITVTAILQGGGIRIEVTDCSGPTVPAFRTSDEMAESGRGLQLVQALAATWGYWRDGGQTTTWFVCTPLIPRASRLPRLLRTASGARSHGCAG